MPSEPHEITWDKSAHIWACSCSSANTVLMQERAGVFLCTKCGATIPLQDPPKEDKS